MDRTWSKRAWASMLASTTILGLAVSTSGGAVAAQEPDGEAGHRGRAFGVVRDLGGAPWTGATVHLLSRPLPGDASVGDADHVTAETDARGRFRAEIAEGRPYSVWAIAAAGDGTFAVSDVAENVFTNDAVVLERQPAARRETPVTLRGIDAWGALAPCRVVASGRAGLHAELALTDARFTLPAWPGDSVRCEVVGATGAWIAEFTLGLGGQTSITCEVAAPVTARIAVRDIDTEAGVDGAEIFAIHGDRVFPIGRTDPDGFAELTMSKVQRDHAVLFARGPRHAPGPLQRGAESRRQGEWPALRPGATTDLFVRLGHGVRCVGRVMLGDGVPAANLALVVDVAGMHFHEKNSRTLRRFRELVRTDDDGNFAIAATLAEYPVRVHGVLDDAHLRGLPAAWRRGLTPLVHALFAPAAGRGDGQLGTVTLSRWCPVAFAVRGSDGAPAGHAQIGIGLDGEPAIFAPDGFARLHADRAGRLAVLLAPERSLVVTARGDDETRLVHVVPGPAQHHAEPEPVDLRLDAPWRISGRVLANDGSGIAGVPVQCVAVGQPAVARVHDELPVERRGPVELLPVRDPRTIAAATREWSATMQGTTDEGGAFSIAVPAIAASYRVQTREARTSVEVTEGSVTDVELRIAR